MINPWQTSDPYAPMYDETVTFSAKGGKRFACRAAVMTDETADPDEDYLDALGKNLRFVVQKNEWSPGIERGDTVKRELNGRTYCISNVVEDYALGIIVRVREA